MSEVSEHGESDGSPALRIAIAATFTAEPLDASIRFWMRELGIEVTVDFAPYNQVFQQLLDPTGVLASNRDGVNIVLVRAEDWAGADSAARENGSLERNARDFAAMIANAAERSSSTYIVGICPASPAVAADPQKASLIAAFEEHVAASLAELKGVAFITTAELVEDYPVAEFYDPHGERLAHIPYTPLFYTALGTMIARRLFAIHSPPYKVIALDCDGTLWRGICGEDGAGGVEIDTPRRVLQEVMVRQHDRGVLICLCSKNNQDDVFDVFTCRNDMILRRDHIAAWRINWSAKSQNLRSLARELGIGLDSFIFIDDDPVECAEVQEQCPEVLTLQLPNAPERIPGFLRHVWPLDRRKITPEDRERTELYRQHFMRERFRQQSPTLSHFLASLNLQIDILPLTMETVGRVSELTLRTNQFNLTTLRRTEAEIRQLCQPGGAECLSVHVKDRFGDYGLVGVVIFEVRADSLIVDIFLLSCRALGRGVEHKVLARLGEIGVERGLQYVVLRCTPSEKNRPAIVFLDGLRAGAKESSGNGFLLRIPAAHAAALVYNADFGGDAQESAAPKSDSQVSATESLGRIDLKSALLSSIPEALYDAESIHARVWRSRARPEIDSDFMPPRSPVEIQVAAIFSDLLGTSEIGLNDSFFALGGHSLLAMQVLSRVNDAFRVEIDPTILFTGNFTVAEVARAVLKEQIRLADPLDVETLVNRLSQLTDDQAESLMDNPAPLELAENK